MTTAYLERSSVVHLTGDQRDPASGRLLCIWCDRPVPQRPAAPLSTDTFVAVTTGGTIPAFTFELRDGVVDRADGIWFGPHHYPPCDRLVVDLDHLVAS